MSASKANCITGHTCYIDYIEGVPMTIVRVNGKVKEIVPTHPSQIRPKREPLTWKLGDVPPDMIELEATEPAWLPE